MTRPGPTPEGGGDRVTSAAATAVSLLPPALPIGDELAARLAGSPLVVMLDIDGTLAPIAPRPEDAAVPAETKKLVAALSSRPNVFVALVSGRAASDGRRMVGATNAWVVGNHGFEVSGPDGEQLGDPKAMQFRQVVAQAVHRLNRHMMAVPGVLVEDKGFTLSVHYRLADPAVVPRVRGVVDETARSLGLRLTDGKMVFEVRPPLHINKGTSVLLLGQHLGGLAAGGSIVFIGDDATDEDAFRALRHRSAHAVTIRVAHGEQIRSAAEFALHDTEEVRAFLGALLATREPAGRRKE